MLQGRRPRQGFDAAHAGRHAGFPRYLEEPDVPRPRHVGATAQLHAEIRQRNHAHPVAVFLFEEGRGAGLEGLFGIHLFRFGRHVAQDAVIDTGLDGGQRFRFDR